MTFNRVISEKHAIGLVRIGNPFVDTMEALLRADDRGAAFSLWRQISLLPKRRPNSSFNSSSSLRQTMSAAQALLKSHRGSPEALNAAARMRPFHPIIEPYGSTPISPASTTRLFFQFWLDHSAKKNEKTGVETSIYG